MTKFIPNDLLNKLKDIYTDEEFNQLENQVNFIDNFIVEHVNEYKYSSDFRKAVDEILAGILSGKLLNIQHDENKLRGE
jgi:hypothetical protein